MIFIGLNAINNHDKSQFLNLLWYNIFIYSGKMQHQILVSNAVNYKVISE